MAAQDFKAAIYDSQQLVELTKSKLDAGRATFIEYIETKQAMLSAQLDALDNLLRLEITRIDLVSTLAGLKPRCLLCFEENFMRSTKTQVFLRAVVDLFIPPCRYMAY